MIEHRQPTISHCPECGYCLTGLPARHRCPECGFVYDEHTRVWRPGSRKAIYLGLLAGGMGAYVPMLIVLKKMIRAGLHGWLDGLMGLIVTLAAIAFVWRGYRVFTANRRGRFAAITPNGLMIRSLGDTVTVPWAQIREITHWVSPTSFLEVSVDDDTHRKSVGPLFSREKNSAGIHQIVAPADRDAFVDAVNAAIRRYRDETSRALPLT